MSQEHAPQPGAHWDREFLRVEQLEQQAPARPNRRQRRDAARAAKKGRVIPATVKLVRVRQVGDALITAVPRGDSPLIRVSRIGGRGQR